MLRNLLARAQAALQSLSPEQRQLRKLLADERRHVAELEAPLPPLRRGEEAEVLAMGEVVQAIRTGEFPVVVAEVVEDRPGIYRYDEPIGPRLPTVDEQFAAFEADPLGAALPGAPAKDNVLFVEVLQLGAVDPRVAADLEVTGQIDRGFLAALARGER